MQTAGFCRLEHGPPRPTVSSSIHRVSVRLMRLRMSLTSLRAASYIPTTQAASRCPPTAAGGAAGGSWSLVAGDTLITPMENDDLFSPANAVGWVEAQRD